MRPPGVLQSLGEERKLRGGPCSIKPFQDNKTSQDSRFHRAQIVMRTACLVIATARVEIGKGSGYTEIDASVEAAPREFPCRDAVGTVTFRFLLEKQV